MNNAAIRGPANPLAAPIEAVVVPMATDIIPMKQYEYRPGDRFLP